MMEKLAKLGEALVSIANILKAGKSLREDTKLSSIITAAKEHSARVLEDTKLNSIITAAKKHPARVLELKVQVQSQELKQQVEDFRKVVNHVYDTGITLEAWIEAFREEAELFEKFLAEKTAGTADASKMADEICEALGKIHRTARHFFDRLNTFNGNLTAARTLATKVAESLREIGRQMNEKTEIAKTAGTAGTVICSLVTAVAFFAGDEDSLPAVAALAASTVILGSATVGAVAAERKWVCNVSIDAQKLDTFVKDLTSNGALDFDSSPLGLDCTGAIEHLSVALDFLKKNAENDRLLVEKDTELARMREELEDLRARVRNLEQ